MPLRRVHPPAPTTRHANDASIPRSCSLAHELVDVLYVTYGALDAFGLPTDEIFNAVHAANLAKTTGKRVVDENGQLGKPEGVATG